MDTKRLHHFKTLCQTGHLRKAAELLNITHAGLSKSIRMLEEELGINLTLKDGRGLRITPEGMALVEKINQCLEAEKELFASVRGDQRRPSIKIGTFEVFSTYLAPELVRSIDKKASVNIVEMIPNDLEQALIEHRIDYGITYLPIPKPQLDHMEINMIRMGVFGLEKWEDFSFDKLPFAVPVSEVEGTPTKVKGLDGWPDGKIHRNIQYSVSLMETALALVRQGLAVAYLPSFIAHLHNKIVAKEYILKELPIPKKIKRDQPVYAVKRKDREEDKAFMSLCRVLRKLN